MQTPPRGAPGKLKGTKFPTQQLIICTNEAEARRKLRSDRLVHPTVASDDSKRTVGIRAASPMLTHQSDQSPLGQKGLGDGVSAEQRRPGHWNDEEIEELRRLVSSNIGPQGKISWVAVEKAWKDLNLGERSKGSLCAKWRDIKNRSVTHLVPDDSKESQGSDNVTSSDSVTTDTTAPTQVQVDSSSTADKDNKDKQSSGTVDAETVNNLGKNGSTDHQGSRWVNRR
ncbi:hypothetical protein I4U23_018078 [Adineta vaga]|nr:hypothetical protein I4U23_018078 [Adineta vaga]